MYEVIAIETKNNFNSELQRLIGTQMEFIKLAEDRIYLLFDDKTYIKTDMVDFFKDHTGQYKLITDMAGFLLRKVVK